MVGAVCPGGEQWLGLSVLGGSRVVLISLPSKHVASMKLLATPVKQHTFHYLPVTFTLVSSMYIYPLAQKLKAEL